MVGEPRRKELMKRLTTAVCGGPSEEEALEAERERAHEEAVQRELAKFAEKQAKQSKTAEKFNDMPSALYRRPPADDDEVLIVPEKEKVVVSAPNNAHVLATYAQEEAAPAVSLSSISNSNVYLSETEANTLKKNIKKLQNRRAVAIANLLSGPSQDPALKVAEKMVIKTEAELSRLKDLKSSSNSHTSSSSTASGKYGGGKLVSSVLIDNGAMMDNDTLVKKLETLRMESKQQVCLP